ncbi:precursor cytochrome c6 [Fragilariopsis cylindrus CCMP1102]|uniref:Cytochrome c-553 n=1 Tax=Fragilariopsis cylindrus CCMP1102 TaxID=635003 RepID=A0A1E7EP28_9STRA|nr:precursor cytochrome c6 [Fragilariopsis cylindrus CCMP1102]|eukprot:OEU07527.1 precursor cytochrome c6 [Fragilariopsis cylindrus CCMP1102]
MKFAIFATLLVSASAFSINKADVAKAAAAGAIAFSVAAGPAFAGDVGAGEQIFNANCAACHAGGQNVIMPEKTLEKEALDQYLSGGRSEKSVMTQVTNGKNAMPAFGGRLSEEDIANVASYVISSAEAGWEE